MAKYMTLSTDHFEHIRIIIIEITMKLHLQKPINNALKQGRVKLGLQKTTNCARYYPLILNFPPNIT